MRARAAVASVFVTVACGGAAQTPPPELPPGPSSQAAPGRARTIADSPHVALGIPRDGNDADDYLMDKEQYVVSYNPRLNGPNWVAWRLDRAELGRASRAPAFHSDSALPQGFYVVKDADYHGSGYDRGHLCPSADRTANAAVNATTFVFTNVHPQLHELNAGPWEDLEKHERELAKSGKDVFIVAGGLFDADPPRVGHEPDPAHRVAVPKASFKILVVLEHGQGADAVRADTPVVAVVMPNVHEARDHAWTDYATSIREIERASGYDFDDRVARAVQDVIESRRP